MRTFLFDYGGTLDTSATHWFYVFQKAYENMGLSITEPLLREAYVMGERTLAKERIIMPDDDFATMLSKKIKIQVEHLQALEILNLNNDVCYAIDVAASEFYRDGKYHLDGEGKVLSTDELIDYYKDLVNTYPIISIEDPVDENDWEGFSKVTTELGDKIQLVGDDLFVTNKECLQKGIDNHAGNAILLKVNQIGTITETLETIKLAKENGYKTIISHRSGETEDTTIADLAVGLDLGQIKTGSMSRTDRICKYNQLMRIEEELN